MTAREGASRIVAQMNTHRRAADAGIQLRMYTVSPYLVARALSSRFLFASSAYTRDSRRIQLRRVHTYK